MRFVVVALRAHASKNNIRPAPILVDLAAWEALWEQARKQPAVDEACPYPGLRAYRSEDAHRFFGRTDDTAKLVAQINSTIESADSTGIIMVIAASGAGKSSLLSAGVLPALRDSDGPEWTIATMSPGARPSAALTDALRSPTWPEGGRGLLIVDQFEELFTAAALFRLALEQAQAGTSWHAGAEQRVRVGDIAEVIGRRLSVAVESVPAHTYGPLGPILATDQPASSAHTQQTLGWKPQRPGLLQDLEISSPDRRSRERRPPCGSGRQPGRASVNRTGETCAPPGPVAHLTACTRRSEPPTADRAKASRAFGLDRYGDPVAPHSRRTQVCRGPRWVTFTLRTRP
ncbi:nSTAND1 domain-containing NTPase [Nocardia sp. NPDC003979]